MKLGEAGMDDLLKLIAVQHEIHERNPNVRYVLGESLPVL